MAEPLLLRPHSLTGFAFAHTVPRRLRLIATALSVAAVVAVGAADWPTWAAATAVLALWMPAAVSELRWTHRHFPDLRYWHPVALGAALLVIVTLALVGLGEASAIAVAAALAIVTVAGLAIHNALDRVTDRWLAQTFPSADSAALRAAHRDSEVVRYRRGETVVAEGDPADRFYIVTSGAAEVTQLTSDGEIYLEKLRGRWVLRRGRPPPIGAAHGHGARCPSSSC